MTDPTATQLEKQFVSEGDQERSVIRNYKLGKTLGEGTFGKVKVGIHIPTGEKVAIKILEKDRMVEQADVERVAREIHILQLIRHPNIVQLYDIIETPKKLFLVTEMATDGELFNYIVAKQRLPEREACKFFQQILSGVEYFHRIGIAHRDLKPENLLLDSGQIKIIDFGLGNTYKAGERLKTACGSPCYAAPEMIAGKKYDGLIADIWSCGVILYAMLCGYLPFEDDNTNVLYKKILRGVFELPDFLSKASKDLLKKILNTNPETRYNIADIRLHPWFSLVPYYPEEQSEGIVVGFNKIPVDPHVLSLMGQYNIDQEHARRDLETNKHNNVTATYYLLVRKFIAQGRRGVLDPNCPLENKVFAPRRLCESVRADRRKPRSDTLNDSLMIDASRKQPATGTKPAVCENDYSETDGHYYKKRSEFCHYKRGTQRCQEDCELGIQQRRRVANNRRGVSHKATRQEGATNKTAIQYDEDAHRAICAVEQDLSFDVLAEHTGAAKVHRLLEPCGELTVPRRQVQRLLKGGEGPAARKNPRAGRRTQYKSVSPHDVVRMGETKAGCRGGKGDMGKGGNTSADLNASCVAKGGDEHVLPITVIRAPQINNINNCNNISINTISTNPSAEAQVPHPPPPPPSGSKASNFRTRKYRTAMAEGNNTQCIEPNKTK